MQHLRVREAGGRDAEVVEHVRAAAHVLHRADALRAGRVRQHVLACAHANDASARSRRGGHQIAQVLQVYIMQCSSSLEQGCTPDAPNTLMSMQRRRWPRSSHG